MPLGWNHLFGHRPRKRPTDLGSSIDGLDLRGGVKPFHAQPMRWKSKPARSGASPTNTTRAGTGRGQRRSVGRTRINRNALLFFAGQTGAFSRASVI
jgi:hypothetical protein